jgi:hypothetical protein
MALSLLITILQPQTLHAAFQHACHFEDLFPIRIGFPTYDSPSFATRTDSFQGILFEDSVLRLL